LIDWSRLAQISVSAGTNQSTEGEQKQCKHGNPSNFDATATWTAFWGQFETVAEHNGWTRQDKAQPFKAGPPMCCTELRKARHMNKHSRPWRIVLGFNILRLLITVNLKWGSRTSGNPHKTLPPLSNRFAYRAYPALPEDHMLGKRERHSFTG
jgi:hypothetical protein